MKEMFIRIESDVSKEDICRRHQFLFWYIFCVEFINKYSKYIREKAHCLTEEDDGTKYKEWNRHTEWI